MSRHATHTFTADEVRSLNIRSLPQAGALAVGSSVSVRWSSGACLSAMANADRLRVQWRGGAVHDVLLTATPQPFGGIRHWLVCPVCGRRRGVLYWSSRLWACRGCLGITYPSQREAGANRALRREQEIRRRLGGSTNILEPFPERPKGMHHTTYRRLVAEAVAHGGRHVTLLWEALRRKREGPR